MVSIEGLVDFFKFNVWRGPNRLMALQTFLIDVSADPDYANNKINFGRVIANVMHEIFQNEKDLSVLDAALGSGFGAILQFELPCFLYPDMVKGDPTMIAIFDNFYKLRNGMDD